MKPISDKDLIVSKMAENLVGSEIIKLAGEVKKMMLNGDKIYNFTIGDFNPEYFPIPDAFKEEIINAYQDNQTNYPASNGMEELRIAISDYISKNQGLEYSKDEFLISGGARPLIYATYQALVDPNDYVIFPTPSWNNNHYTHLSHANPIFIEATAENNFMPVRKDIEPHIKKATLVTLCSPLNPTGTLFSKEQLVDICEMILEENKRRKSGQKPVYLLYVQIYWQLVHGNYEHVDPVSLFPEMRNYTVFIDGISKVFASTGVRVGWAFGPERIMGKMKAILGHVGAWAPKAEQIATGKFLNRSEDVKTYLLDIKTKAYSRLSQFHAGFEDLRKKGFPVLAITPQAAIYLTVKFDLKGKIKPNGKIINTTEDITAYILNHAKLAIVPFYAFGAPKESTWYRLSIGTSNIDEIPAVFKQLESALSLLK